MVITGSVNVLLPVRSLAITWTSADLSPLDQRNWWYKIHTFASKTGRFRANSNMAVDGQFLCIGSISVVMSLAFSDWHILDLHATMRNYNKTDVKRRNTLGCLDSHTCRGLRFWNSRKRSSYAGMCRWYRPWNSLGRWLLCICSSGYRLNKKKKRICFKVADYVIIFKLVI